MSRDSLSFAAARRIYLSGEPASAAKSLRSYLESYPKGYYTADALYCLSDCYLKTGERSRAIETLAALADAGQNQYTHRALKMPMNALRKLRRLTANWPMPKAPLPERPRP